MLAALLELQQLAPDRFLTQTHQKSFRNSLFGGQVLGQALMAAGLTVEDRPPNSLHAYFLRAGVADSPIEYQVTILRDGKSVSTRSISAIQNEALIFSMSASFHKPEPGFQHQILHPEGNITPETLLSQSAVVQNAHLVRRVAETLGTTPIELIPYDHGIFRKSPSEKKEVRGWMRSVEPLGKDALKHYGALAFASDIGLLASSLLSHDASMFDGDVFPASMDHSLWFHGEPDFEQWHQYITSSPWADNARAFCQGAVYDQSNRLIASVAQEGLIRPVKT